MDVWGKSGEVSLQAPLPAPQTKIDHTAIRKAAKILGAAKRPLIICGGGAQDASEEVTALSAMLQAPVLAFRRGRGVLDGRNPFSVTLPLGHDLWGEADVVLAVGTRLLIQFRQWGVNPDAKIIRIDADPKEHNRLHKPALALTGDSKPILQSLLAELPAHNARRPSRKAEMEERQAAWRKRFEKIAPQIAYLEAIREELPEDGIFVEDITQMAFAARVAFPVYKPRTYISPGFQDPLGWGFATALGVQHARPDVPVVAICGDGGFMFTATEMATAMRHRIPLTTIVFNDGAYGNVRRIQQERFGNRLIASDLTNPDFVAFGKSFGAEAVRALNPDELRQALRRAFAHRDGPTLIEVPVGAFPSPWEFLNMPKVFEPAVHTHGTTHRLATRAQKETHLALTMLHSAEIKISMQPITTTGELADVCKRMASHPFVTIDTEFLRETTYYPLLCVAQMATSDEAVVVDALAPGIDLAPFYALMADEKVMKVFHAARQDIEIVWHGAKLIPHPIFDTQVAAMVLGYGDSISYDQLVQRITGDALDKSNRFTDWTRRPLTEAQLTYAISDVTHLRDVYLALVDDLGRRGRADWVQDEMEILTSPDTYRMEPEKAWQRLKTRVRKPKELAVLIEVAAWRESEAQSRDVPRSRVLKDDAIADIAVQAPSSLEKLKHLRSLPKGFERSRWGEAIVAAVERGLARDPKELPQQVRVQPAANGAAVVELLKVLLRMISERHHVAAKVIATVDELERIAADDNAEVPALHGWRRELFGDKALALKHGKLALAIERGRVTPVEREQSPPKEIED